MVGSTQRPREFDLSTGPLRPRLELNAFDAPEVVAPAGWRPFTMEHSPASVLRRRFSESS
jgi:hypothetical protein